MLFPSGTLVESDKNDILELRSSSAMIRRPFQVIDLEAETYKETKHVIEELEVLRVVKKYCEGTKDDKEVVRTLEWLLRLVRTPSFASPHLLYLFTSRILISHPCGKLG
jgi:hypothetical protein